jgi:hypothetical protein
MSLSRTLYRSEKGTGCFSTPFIERHGPGENNRFQARLQTYLSISLYYSSL